MLAVRIMTMVVAVSMFFVSLLPHKLFQVSLKQRPGGAELASQLVPASHQQVFDVLRVDVRVVGVNEVVLVYDDVAGTPLR